MPKYKAILFDLDRTLWDFEKNSDLKLAELFDRYELSKKGIPSAIDFITEYKIINDRLWELLNVGKITKEELRDRRFYEAMLHFNLDSRAIAKKLGHDYIAECPSMPHLMEGTREIIDYLKPNYKLAIISNGFIQTQKTKLKSTGLDKDFEVVVTGEGAGYHKPHPKIFEMTLDELKVKTTEAIIVGDHHKADIVGAKNVGMDSIYFNPNKEISDVANHSISRLIELKELL